MKPASPACAIDTCYSTFLQLDLYPLPSAPLLSLFLLDLNLEKLEPVPVHVSV